MKSKNEQRHNAPKASPDIRPFVPGIKALHKLHRSSSDEDLKNQSREELIESFKIEMNAKNLAYYFILESGYFMAFRDYWFKARAQEDIMNQSINEN